MKRFVALLLAASCMTGCSASAKNANMADAAAPAMKSAEQFSLTQTFDMAEYERSGGSVDEIGSTSPTTDSITGESVEACDQDFVPLLYAVFEASDNTVSAEDTTQVFVSRSWSPVYGGDETETAQWLNEQVWEIQKEAFRVRENLEDQAVTYFRFCQEESELPFYAYSYYSSMNVARQDETVVSLLQLESIYCGGAHPSYVQNAYNFDLTAQTQLQLSDVLYPNAEQVLLEQLLQRLDSRFSQLESVGFFDDYKETVVSFFSRDELTPYWCFSENGLVIYFNCYDIAPYAAGIIKVEFPYEILDGILLPEYYPGAKPEQNGGFILLDGDEGRSIIAVSSQDDGEMYLLGTQGTAYDVRLYQLSSWIAEETPIQGQMLFASSQLTSTQALALTEPIENSSPSYLLTYRSGAGEQYRYAISRQQLLPVSNFESE